MRKEEFRSALQMERKKAERTAYIMLGPMVNTWSTIMPAYCYTELCPDPEYTKDKKKLLEVRNRRNAAKSDLNEVVREIAANEKQEKKWDLCMELIEAVIDSL